MRAGAVAAAAMLATFLGASGALLPPLATVAVAILVLAAVAASWRPPVAVAIAFGIVSLVPIYWSPDVPGTRIGLFPVVFVCVALLPSALKRSGDLRIGAIDWFVLAYLVLRIVAYALNAQRGIGPSVDSVFGVALPFVTLRLLGLTRGASASAAAGVVVAGALSAALAIREVGGSPNPFFSRFPNGHQHAFFARSDMRLGQVRPEASFGHSIALGMFLALAATLTLVLAWQARGLIARTVLAAAAGVAIWGLGVGLVRGPLVMFALAVVIVLIGESRRGRHAPAIAAVAAVVVLVNVGSLATVFQLRDASFEPGRVQASGQYRVEIWDVISDPSVFSLLGRPVTEDEAGGFTRAVGRGVGLKSFDNAYALIYVGFGALTLLAFAGVGVMVARTAFRGDLSLLDRAWSAALLAAFVNLMTVNLLTQFAHIFWMAIGLIAATVQRADDRVLGELESERGRTALASLPEPASAA